MPKTNKTARTKHLATIAEAFDRAATSPDRSLTRLVGSMIIEEGRFCERFMHGWTDAAVRAAVLGYAQGAPPAELAAMAHWARREIAWIEWWDLAGQDEGELVGDCVLLLPERVARRVDALERLAA